MLCIIQKEKKSQVITPQSPNYQHFFSFFPKKSVHMYQPRNIIYYRNPVHKPKKNEICMIKSVKKYSDDLKKREKTKERDDIQVHFFHRRCKLKHNT